jgi:hypothetical protein
MWNSKQDRLSFSPYVELKQTETGQNEDRSKTKQNIEKQSKT